MQFRQPHMKDKHAAALRLRAFCFSFTLFSANRKEIAQWIME
jgi:hypothetical protein